MRAWKMRLLLQRGVSNGVNSEAYQSQAGNEMYGPVSEERSLCRQDEIADFVSFLTSSFYSGRILSRTNTTDVVHFSRRW